MATLPTYDEIMERILNNVPNEVDKREGSVIWDAVAPCARELVTMYEEVNTALQNTFAGTADREWLIKCCSEIGIQPFEATYAVRKMTVTPVTLDLAIGTRFNYDDLNFYISAKLETAGEYEVTCEEAGEAGNNGSGYLIPIEYISGLETAILTPEVIIYGEEEEATEDLRQRYFDTLPTMTLDGNVAQYGKWCREYAGIGNYKIFPEWDGKNTVKVSILSAENTIASQKLIDDFQEYLDPKASETDTHGEGLGMGKAPIGAIVTVSTATEKAINVTAQIQLKAGYEKVTGLEDEIAVYLEGLNYVRDAVSYIALSAVIQNNRCVDSVIEVTINGGKVDVPLGDEEIAKLGSTDWEYI